MQSVSNEVMREAVRCRSTDAPAMPKKVRGDMLISGYRERLDRAPGETSMEVRIRAETAEMEKASCV
jgi:hypothetical protein